MDTVQPLTEPEATFLHRFYDRVVTSGEASRGPWSAALRTPIDHVLAIGTPRTDAFFEEATMAAGWARLMAAHPTLLGSADRAVCADVPRPWAPQAGGWESRCRGAQAGPPSGYALVLKTHPNLDVRGESRSVTTWSQTRPAS